MKQVEEAATRQMTLYRQYRAAKTEAFRWAIASMEIMGLTPDAQGKDELSITKRLRTSQVSPSGLVAEVRGEPPRRTLPMM